MSKYRKEITQITKIIESNNNKPMSYAELKSNIFNINGTILLKALTDGLLEGTIVSKDDKYQLPETSYTYNLKRKEEKRKAIIEANNRMKKIRSIFTEEYYEIDNAKKLYLESVGYLYEDDFKNDMKSLGYNVTNNFLLFKYLTIIEYLQEQLTKQDIIEMQKFKEKYLSLIEKIDFNNLIKNLEQTYQIIKFDKDSYINIKKLSEANIYLSTIRKYCNEVFDFVKNGDFFTIRTLKKNGFTSEIYEIGCDDIFYESLLKYDGRFLYRKMTNLVVFSTQKKPLIQNIVFEIVLKNKIITIYDLQDILRDEYGIATSFISDNGSTLLSRGLLFGENTDLYYSKELEKIYFDKNDYYEEIKYE